MESIVPPSSRWNRFVVSSAYFESFLLFCLGRTQKKPFENSSIHYDITIAKGLLLSCLRPCFYNIDYYYNLSFCDINLFCLSNTAISMYRKCSHKHSTVSRNFAVIFMVTLLLLIAQRLSIDENLYTQNLVFSLNFQHREINITSLQKKNCCITQYIYRLLF